MRNSMNKFLSQMEDKNKLAKTLISLTTTKSIIIKDLNCFQIMDLTDEERAMQAQVNWWRFQLRFIWQYFVQFLFCKIYIYACLSLLLLEHFLHSWSDYQIILFLTSKCIQGDGVFEQSKGEPEAVSEEMELREIGQWGVHCTGRIRGIKQHS